MLAKLTRELPTGEGWLYEPKWDGFRAIVFRDGDDLEIGSRNERPLTRYFPELVEPLCTALPKRCVLDGEVVIATEHGLEFDLLSLRIHPAASRINLLAGQTPASFVAFDLLALGDDDLRGRPFADRRELLDQALPTSNERVMLTPVTTDAELARDWFHRFEGAGLDGVIAKPLASTYREGDRGWAKVKHQRTADCVVAGYRDHKGGGVGSLLLGLYDAAGRLHHVGVASSFAAPDASFPARRAAAAPRPCARRSPLEGLGRSRRRVHTYARRAEPLERGQEPQLGAVAHRARRRGRVRAPPR